MAGWERYGESKKYNKDVEANQNPKHVGESLRVLTLEDRLELRRISRENERKRAAMQMELEDDPDDEVDAAVSKAPRTDSGAAEKETIQMSVDDDVEEQVTAPTNAERVVDLEETSKASKPRVRPASEVSEDLTIVEKTSAMKPTRTNGARTAAPDLVAVVELDDPNEKAQAPSAAAAAPAAAAARRAARKANAAKAKAAIAPAPDPAVHVLE